MNFICNSRGRKLFESKELRRNYQISMKFWGFALKELTTELKFGVPYPPSKFAQAFDDLYESGTAEKEIRILPTIWED